MVNVMQSIYKWPSVVTHMQGRTLLRMAERQMLKPKVLVVSGTTAVGKTDLSISLAKKLNGEIISADSAQVFKGMNIGTAKLDYHAQKETPHHLLDVVSVTEMFTAGDFRDRTYEIIEDMHSRGKVPIIVGGTSFYIKTFLEGRGGEAPPSTSDGQSRVDDVIKGKNWEESLECLARLDKEYASTLSCGDWYRLRRALEICIVSGKPVTHFKRDVKLEELPFECKCLFLTMPRDMLYKRIDTRCEAIVENGLFEEVVDLVVNHGLVAESQAGRCIGYRQALNYLKEAWDFPEARKQGAPCQKVDTKSELAHKQFVDFILHYQASTRQLAQSQLTWHRKEGYFQWLNMAPGGHTCGLDRVSEAVCGWLTNDRKLPPELDGTSLKQLTKVEHQAVKSINPHIDLNVHQNLCRLEQLLSKHRTSNS